MINNIRTKFKSFSNGNILEESKIISKGIFSNEDSLIVELRDDKGNITQYHNPFGVYTCIIWGYNKTKLIAKIENATYNQVQPYEANLQTLSNGEDESAFVSALNSLRTNLRNAMITTYTHKPLVAVTSVTDPKGDTQTYFYDSLTA